jgi:hypothetical protein
LLAAVVVVMTAVAAAALVDLEQQQACFRQSGQPTQSQLVRVGLLASERQLMVKAVMVLYLCFQPLHQLAAAAVVAVVLLVCIRDALVVLAVAAGQT